MGYGSDPLGEKIKEWGEEAQVAEWEKYERYVLIRQIKKRTKKLDAKRLLLEEEVKMRRAVIEEIRRSNYRLVELAMLCHDWKGLSEEFMLLKEKFEGLKRDTEETGAKYSSTVLLELDAIASQMEEFDSKCRAELEKFQELKRRAFDDAMKEKEVQGIRENNKGLEVHCSKLRLEHKNLAAELEKLKPEVDRLEAEIENLKLCIPDDSSSSLNQNLRSPSLEPYLTLGGPLGSLNVRSDQLVPTIPKEEDRVKFIGLEVDGVIVVLKTVDMEDSR